MLRALYAAAMQIDTSVSSDAIQHQVRSILRSCASLILLLVNLHQQERNDVLTPFLLMSALLCSGCFACLQEVAANHPGKSVAQVVLRWALQRGQVVIPRSSSTQHIADNLALFDFELSDVEMQAINGLDGTWKTGGLPLPVA